jgi:hypothetical protein
VCGRGWQVELKIMNNECPLNMKLFSIFLKRRDTFHLYPQSKKRHIIQITVTTLYKQSDSEIKWKKKYHTVGTVPNFIRKIVEREGKIDTHNTQIHNLSIS